MSSLTLQILLNNNTIESSFAFYPGEDVELRVQVIEDDTDQQFKIPDLGRDVSFILPGNPDNLEVVNADVDVDSRNSSIVSTELTDAITDLMTSGNLRMVLSFYEEEGIPDLREVVSTSILTVNEVEYEVTVDGTQNGTIVVDDPTDLTLGSIGTITVNDEEFMTVKIDTVATSAPYTVSLIQVRQRTRMAQLKNGIKRLTPNPII
jgi:hypothetical protein